MRIIASLVGCRAVRYKLGLGLGLGLGLLGR